MFHQNSGARQTKSLICVGFILFASAFSACEPVRLNSARLTPSEDHSRTSLPARPFIGQGNQDEDVGRLYRGFNSGSGAGFDSDLDRNRLLQRRTLLRGWAERCGPSVAKSGCDVGDAVLYDGILCLSGEVESCEAVAKAQGPDGRMWRSAHRVDFEVRNSFSRDMSLGVLAYLLATHDMGLATRWMAWLEANDYRTCVEASDNRCDFTPGLWDLFGDVWAHIGLAPHRRMTGDFVDNEFLLPLHARLAPVGFPLHLVAVNLMLRRSMGLESAMTLLSASMLVERQPANPLFQWLHQGNTSEVANLTLGRCPTAAPSRRTQWAVERSDEENAFRASMGWECIALLNLMLR